VKLLLFAIPDPLDRFATQMHQVDEILLGHARLARIVRTAHPDPMLSREAPQILLGFGRRTRFAGLLQLALRLVEKPWVRRRQKEFDHGAGVQEVANECLEQVLALGGRSYRVGDDLLCREFSRRSADKRPQQRSVSQDRVPRTTQTAEVVA
jgi:hypothetical protein